MPETADAAPTGPVPALGALGYLGQCLTEQAKTCSLRGTFSDRAQRLYDRLALDLSLSHDVKIVGNASVDACGPPSGLAVARARSGHPERSHARYGYSTRPTTLLATRLT